MGRGQISVSTTRGRRHGHYGRKVLTRIALGTVLGALVGALATGVVPGVHPFVAGCLWGR